MALIVNGTTIPVTGTVRVGGTEVLTVKVGDTVVWQKQTKSRIYWKIKGRTSVYYQTSDQGRTQATSGGSYTMGATNDNGAAWQWDFSAATVTEAINGRSMVAGTAQIDLWINCPSAVAAKNGYLCAGQSFNQSGLQKIFRAGSANRFSQAFPKSSNTFQTIKIADGVMQTFLSATNKTLGGKIVWATAKGLLNDSTEVWLSAEFQ